MEYILAVLVALSFYLEYHDYHTTKKILDNGGRELNPFMAWTLKKFGYKGMAIEKALYVGALFLLTVFSPSWWLVGGASIVALALGYCVYNNVKELGKMGLPYQNFFIGK